MDLSKLLNEENAKYKPFKFYFNGNGDLMLDVCMMTKDDVVIAEDVFMMYNVIINYLDTSYRSLMKAIW